MTILLMLFGPLTASRPDNLKREAVSPRRPLTGLSTGVSGVKPSSVLLVDPTLIWLISPFVFTAVVPVAPQALRDSPVWADWEAVALRDSLVGAD